MLYVLSNTEPIAERGVAAIILLLSTSNVMDLVHQYYMFEIDFKSLNINPCSEIKVVSNVKFKQCNQFYKVAKIANLFFVLILLYKVVKVFV